MIVYDVLVGQFVMNLMIEDRSNMALFMDVCYVAV